MKGREVKTERKKEKASKRAIVRGEKKGKEKEMKVM